MASLAAMSDAPSFACSEADARVPAFLVFRSCRLPVFEKTLRWIRARWPSARIDVLSSPGCEAQARAAGADRVFEFAGHSISAVRHLGLLQRLRRGTYDAVVVPQMDSAHHAYANVYRAAAVLGTTRVIVAAGDEAPVTYDRSAFAVYAIGHSLSRLLACLDAPLLLLLLAAAWVWPRRRVTPSNRRRRVLHVISSLGVGGAQVQLAELLAHTPRDTFDVDVVVLSRDDGAFARQWLGTRKVNVRYCDNSPLLSQSAIEIALLCRSGRYDLVHTWLFMANLVGAAGARLGGVPRIIGSVRNLSLWKRTWYAHWWYRIADALATRIADQVTVNARALVSDHAAWAWFPPERLHVVPNGLDPTRVMPHGNGARALLREELGVTSDTPVVGVVGRLAPEKDQATFIRAFARLLRERPDVHGVIVGDGQLRPELERLATELGVGRALHFLGERTDPRRIIAGLDVFALTSVIEGFPNVLLEATFLGVPAVATDVGGAADVLDADDLMNVGDPHGLAAALLQRLGDADAARQHATVIQHRALERFTAERTAACWLALYDDLLNVKETVRAH